MSLTVVSSTAQLDGILTKSADKLSVIDFHATWCGPCHMIAPTFEALAKEYPNVNFLKCDVDQARDVASRYEVSAMPTFIFLKGSHKVEQVRGANKAALEGTLRRLASAKAAGGDQAFPGKGNSLSGSAPANPQPAGGGVLSGVWDFYQGLDPQIKILVWVLVAYVGLVKLA